MKLARLRRAARRPTYKSASLRTLALAAAATSLVAGSPERGDPAARLSTADGALEYWDFAVRFEPGHRLVARVLVTNEGPGDRTAVGVGHLMLPDGEIVEFRNGRREGRWSVTPDGRSLRIGSTRLDLTGSTRVLEYDNHRRGIQIRLRLGGGAKPRFPRSGEARDYRVDLLELSAPAEATVLVPGMPAPLALDGRGALTHTWMDESETRLVLRRIDFASLDAKAALYVRDVMSPEGKSHRWLVALRDGEVLVESSDFEIAVEDPPGGPRGGYPVPRRLRIQGAGFSGAIELGRKLAEHDPLGDLPQPFRFLLSFAMRPRRVWTDSPFSLRVEAAAGRDAALLAGIGITSVTYLNPLSSPTAGSLNRTPGSASTLE